MRLHIIARTNGPEDRKQITWVVQTQLVHNGGERSWHRPVTDRPMVRSELRSGTARGKEVEVYDSDQYDNIADFLPAVF